MARGHQKAQSQAKAQERDAANKKKQGHSANEQKKAAQKALVFSCAVCKVSIIIWLFKWIETPAFTYFPFIYSRKCLIRKRTSNTLKINTQNPNCQLN